MTDVSVTIQETPLAVVVDTGTPRVTITEQATGNVTVTQAAPVIVTAASGSPRIFVNNGGAGSVPAMLESLIGKLTRTHMDTALAADLEKLQSLWLRIGNELILTYPDGLSIQEAGRSYTNTQIQNLTDNINSTQAALRSYVDNQILGLTGNTSNLQEVLRTYTDSQILSTFNTIDGTQEALRNYIDSQILDAAGNAINRVEALRTYTDSRILDVVGDINISVDGKVNIAFSSVDQKADSIDQRVTQIKGDTDNRMLIAESRILQTEQSITQTVSRMDSLDGPGGAVEVLQSAITQTANSVTLEASRRQQVADDLVEARSAISVLTDTITLMTTTLNVINGWKTDTTMLLGEDGIEFSILQTLLNDTDYSIGVVQSLLANKWGVEISEDVAGRKYASGFSLLLHPIWLNGQTYTVGDTVAVDASVYRCIVSHTADATNSPTGAAGTTYWLLLPEGVKSSFIVRADRFAVMGPDGSGDALMPFTVDIVDGQAVVGIHGQLIVGGSLPFNALSNEAQTVINNSISAAEAQALSDAKFYADNQFVTQVLYQADIDNIQSQLDGQVVAWFYSGYVPTRANVPANAWTTTAIKEQHANDTFTRLDTGQSWRWVYDGGVWKWVEIMDTATTAALSLAAQAQDTADGKRRVFVTQPTVPYDVGDLWTTATTLKRCVTAKTSAGSFAEGDWISAADVTDYLTIYDTVQGYANSAQTQALLDAQTYADGKFVTQVLHQAAVDNLQGQLDGQVIAWFYDYAPTLSNAPASLWTTEALRDQHANDTFTHLTTGQSWRWVYDTGAWKWLEIADTATTAALAAASQAQDTADNKRRVFTVQPTVPYDVGDLWADGTTLLRCVTAKTDTGSYAVGDWIAVATKAPQLPPDVDLFAHWDFDDTLLDRVSLLTPTQYGTGGYVGGISGRGRNFVYATKDYLKLPTGAMAGIANGAGFTLSLWFKADSDQMYANPRIFTIAETNLNFTLGLQGTAPSPLYPVVRYAGAVKYSPVVVSQGEWHHIVVRVNSLTAWDVTLWLDGVLCTNWVTGVIGSNAVFNALGAYSGTVAGWTGVIDEVRVYNTKAITDDHVRALYLNPGGSSKNVAPDVDKTDYVTIYANAETFPAVVTPTTMKRTGSTFEKVGATTAWDAQAYSPQRYTGGCRLAFKTGTPNKAFMMGFALDPTLSVIYTETDYQFYLKSDATANVFEKTAGRGISAPYTTDTLFEIIYDGSEVRYLVDGVAVRTVTGLANNLSFYLDSSFYEVGSKATHVQWGPYSPSLSVVQAHADLARVTAEAYADGQVTLAEQRAIEAAQAKADLAETTAKAYADGIVTEAEQRAIDAAQAKADAAETTAKAYADGVVTAAEQRAIEAAQAKADAAEVAAKAYADGVLTTAEQYAIAEAQAKANLAEITAKAYADGIVTAEEQRAIADAQAKADAARETAKTYADGIVTSAEQRAIAEAQAKADLAETTAKAYADGEITAAEQRAIAAAQTKADLAEATAKAYADGEVTAAEQRVIAEAQAKADLAETLAKAYADDEVTAAEQRAIDAAQAKANLAETNAKAWADGIVTAEEQRAIADAQAKANAAQAAAQEYADGVVLSAEQRAALDAQAKANLAEITAKAYADGKVTDAEQRAIADAQSKALMGHNLLNWYESWTPGVGNTGQFVRTGLDTESLRALATGPFGQREIVWQAIPSGDGAADGGFSTTVNPAGFLIDPDKTYIFGCYMQRLTGNGTLYFGCYTVKSLSDVVNSNPYFASTNSLNDARWMLAIGVIHGRGYTGPSTGLSGIYDVETGVKLVAGSDFKVDNTLADPTIQRMRAFYYNSTTGNGLTVEAQFARPFVMEASVCPPIDQLTGKLSTIAAGADVTDYSTIYANTETFPAVTTPDRVTP